LGGDEKDLLRDGEVRLEDLDEETMVKFLAAMDGVSNILYRYREEA